MNLRATALGLVRWPPRMLTAGCELLVSRRGLALLFLGLAAGFTTAGWLRPPLSKDISSLHLPLGVCKGHEPPPEEMLGPNRPIPPDSVGVFLLALLALSGVTVWRWPDRIGTVAGLVLCAGVVGNAAVALNHPALIELLEQEFEQRQQINKVIASTPVKNAMTKPDNARVGALAMPQGDEQRGDLCRGWPYLLYGWWLVLWGVTGTVAGYCGPLRRRLAFLAGWLGAGVGLAAVACAPRLTAEYYWARAVWLEGQCQPAAAREALQEAVSRFPQFERMQRTWLLAGKLDWFEGKATSRERFFRVYQLARDNTQPRAVTYQEDLPWLIPGVTDSRSGMQSTLSDYVMSLMPGTTDSGTPGHTSTPGLLQGPLAAGVGFERRTDPSRATALMKELAAEAGADHVAVRSQRARLWTEIGLVSYCQAAGQIPSGTGLSYFRQDRNVVAAQEAWLRALQALPGKRDCHLYLGLVQARLNPGQPELVEAHMEPVMAGLGDQVLYADTLDFVANAYFAAGQASEARKRYAKSYDMFCLPKVINVISQRGLGGL